MIRLNLYIEKIGGISGKRVCCRFVKSAMEHYAGGIGLRISDKSNTLLIEDNLLEPILDTLNKNERQVWDNDDMRVSPLFLICRATYIDSKITDVEFISAQDYLKEIGVG